MELAVLIFLFMTITVGGYLIRIRVKMVAWQNGIENQNDSSVNYTDEGDDRSQKLPWIKQYLGEPKGFRRKHDYDATKTVFFGTDRIRQEKKGERAIFTNERASELTFGKSEIHIPKIDNLRKFAKSAGQGKFVSFVVRCRSKIANKSAEYFDLPSCLSLNAQDFTNSVNEELSQPDYSDGSALVFIHGYNVDFKRALFRAAQLAASLDFKGPTFAYSWPSQGKLRRYQSDGYSSRQSAKYLDGFIDQILKVEGLDRVHIIAHSMGNRLLVDLFTKARTHLRERKRATQQHGISQLIMAAPDVDQHIFDDALEDFTDHSDGVTVFACAYDKALMISKGKAGYRRAGQIVEGGSVISKGNADVVDVSDVCVGRIFGLNHSLFSEHEVLIDHMKQLLAVRDQTPLTRRSNVKLIREVDGLKLWRCEEA